MTGPYYRPYPRRVAAILSILGDHRCLLFLLNVLSALKIIALALSLSRRRTQTRSLCVYLLVLQGVHTSSSPRFKFSLCMSFRPSLWLTDW
jgi:hypothetical protein